MPVALAHVYLHAALCGAVARLAPQTAVALRVQMTYPTGGTEVDKTFRFTRDEDAQTVVEFDVPRGTYRLRVDVPKYGCAATAYLDIFAEHNRNVSVALADGAQPSQVPAVVMGGSAPLSFLYVKPTFVLFDKGLACNQPVDAQLPERIDIEYDQGAYYASLYADASLAAHSPVVVALRLKTPTGTAHYIRVPIAVPLQPHGWPDRTHMDVTSDMLDDIATSKTETLLCPKIWETSVH